MKTTFYFLIVILFLIVGCSKEGGPGDIQEQTFEVNATASTEWKYFSFEINDTVEIADPDNSDDWDYAYARWCRHRSYSHRFRIRRIACPTHLH